VDNSTAETFAKKSAIRTKLRHIDQRQWWVLAERAGINSFANWSMWERRTICLVFYF